MPLAVLKGPLDKMMCVIFIEARDCGKIVKMTTCVFLCMFGVVFWFRKHIRLDTCIFRILRPHKHSKNMFSTESHDS